MSEWRQHTNPWADKLAEVSLPDGGESWKAMEALLDRERPAAGWRDWRRWLLLILLLLLLIGVCNCPARRWLSANSRMDGTERTSGVDRGSGTDRASGAERTRGSGQTGGAKQTGGAAQTSANGRPAGDAVTRTVQRVPGAAAADSAKVRNTGGPGRVETASVVNRGRDSIRAIRKGRPVAGKHRQTRVEGDDRAEEAMGKKKETGEKRTVGREEHGQVTVRGREQATGKKKGSVAGKEKNSVTEEKEKDPVTAKEEDRISVKGQDSAGKGKPVVGPAINRDSLVKARKDSTRKARQDSIRKANLEPEKKEKQNGWVIGIGLNQFFTVGGQHASSYNSGGITGAIGDYIPVPMIRYYFNPKLYVQLEAQFNTPQYTKKNLVAALAPHDSLSPTQYVTRSVSISKLFYFNVPLSVHYTVYDHLGLGAGLQYSRLTNGIGDFNNRFNTSGVVNETTETKSFKDDTVNRTIRTAEFRFLVDANYEWKHFIFGIRYNQALSKFIHVQLSPGQVTQARNSSLQLFARYILFDSRKKKPLLPTK
jgi:hypothetical protein